MARVKIGRDIRNEGDLQNLVTSIIFRTEGEFTIEEILPVINWNLRGSIYYKSEKVKECLENTLQVLERTEYVEYENGVFKGTDLLLV